jgi:Asp-tRNA(Asn)/Glu-tRNA(Gln) amidotransferase A subunit family amidase
MSDILGEYPRLFPRPEHTIAGIGRALRAGEITCVELLQSCLNRVDEWEPDVHAWVVLDHDRALQQARALDKELKSGKDRGPLHGIPIGIKDIIDVRGLPTACGAKRWAKRIAESDAHMVVNLRWNGAVIMGKTVTTPYAWIDPPRTRNPWKLDRSPGGSSSGSAAAVACGMCLGAVGTQTGGSITRPASFCGVAGLKPAFSTRLIDGVHPFAPSLDQPGPIAQSAGDLHILVRAMDDLIENLEPALESSPGPEGGRPLIGRLRGFFDRRAESTVRAAFDDAMKVLTNRGAEIVDVPDPVDFEQILRSHRCVMASEAARIHSDWLDTFPDDYPPRIRELILEGRAYTAVEYLKGAEWSVEAQYACIEAAASARVDVLVTPSTTSTATDLSTTGDPAFNSPWSYTHLPTVSIPSGLAADGLPVAIQLVGKLGPDDEAILRVAQWCEQAIRGRRQ